MSGCLRILVTGGAGYIGSHTSKLLRGCGFEPIVVDNLSTGHREAVKWGPLIEDDLSSSVAIQEVLTKQRIDAVVHFAASAYVGESMSDPRKYFRNNVVSTLNLLEGMLGAGVKTIVFSSSCAIYGIPEKVPIGEEQPQHPVNPYGESKLFMERALGWYGKAYGFSWMALRYFNAAGADPEGELGEWHKPETHLIPLLMRAALDEGQPVEIYGTDYPTPDGTAVRDYIHVTDLAEAHLLALRQLLGGGGSGALNLGTGRGYSVREVVRAVEEASGRRVRTRLAGRRAGDPPALVADPGKAGTGLGWKPRHSALKTITETAWNWHAMGSGVR